jgi:hypothetical protein
MDKEYKSKCIDYIQLQEAFFKLQSKYIKLKQERENE